MWDSIGRAATTGLIAEIRQALRTARQNSRDCERLSNLVDRLAELLPRLPEQDPAALRLLSELNRTLSEARDLVISYQSKGRTYKFFAGSKLSDRLKDVAQKIADYISLIPTISYIDIAHRLHHLSNGGTNIRPTSRSQPVEEEESGADDLEFMLPEIRMATNNFAVELSEDASSGTKVYRGKLRNGQEVAVKRLNPARRGAEDAFFTERHILSPLRHDHIIRLLGHCADDGGERVLVTQYMPNGSLYDHLHGHHHQRQHQLSPVTASWKARVQVLLGAARAVKHLHCHAVPLVIHGNVASSNILLDATWAPRLSDFGASAWRAAGVASQPVDEAIAAAAAASGYADPEYCSTGRIRPESDVYSLGVVILETLTGQPSVVSAWDDATQSVVTMTLASFALPSVQAGRLGDVLDRRPAPEPTMWRQQILRALQLVANTGAHCLCLHGDNRPAIADVVSNLEQALRLL